MACAENSLFDSESRQDFRLHCINHRNSLRVSLPNASQRSIPVETFSLECDSQIEEAYRLVSEPFLEFYLEETCNALDYYQQDFSAV